MGKIKAFLQRKDIEISWKRYFIDAMGAMAQGLFCSLLIGMDAEEAIRRMEGLRCGSQHPHPLGYHFLSDPVSGNRCDLVGLRHSGPSSRGGHIRLRRAGRSLRRLRPRVRRRRPPRWAALRFGPDPVR